MQYDYSEPEDYELEDYEDDEGVGRVEYVQAEDESDYEEDIEDGSTALGAPFGDPYESGNDFDGRPGAWDGPSKRQRRVYPTGSVVELEYADDGMEDGELT